MWAETYCLVSPEFEPLGSLVSLMMRQSAEVKNSSWPVIWHGGWDRTEMVSICHFQVCLFTHHPTRLNYSLWKRKGGPLYGDGLKACKARQNHDSAGNQTHRPQLIIPHGSDWATLPSVSLQLWSPLSMKPHQNKKVWWVSSYFCFSVGSTQHGRAQLSKCIDQWLLLNTFMYLRPTMGDSELACMCIFLPG